MLYCGAVLFALIKLTPLVLHCRIYHCWLKLFIITKTHPLSVLCCDIYMPINTSDISDYSSHPGMSTYMKCEASSIDTTLRHGPTVVTVLMAWHTETIADLQARCFSTLGPEDHQHSRVYEWSPTARVTLRPYSHT